MAQVVPNVFHAGASPFPMTFIKQNRSLDTITYLVTRRVLTFISIATVLLALCLQSSAIGSATWWSEGSTFGYTYTGPRPLTGAEATPVVWVALLQADL